jgi:ABC-type enterobactin transport system permease subunit
VSNAISMLPPLVPAPSEERLPAALAAPLAGAYIAVPMRTADFETVLRTRSTSSDLLGRVRFQAAARPTCGA